MESSVEELISDHLLAVFKAESKCSCFIYVVIREYIPWWLQERSLCLVSHSLEQAPWPGFPRADIISIGI